MVNRVSAAFQYLMGMDHFKLMLRRQEEQFDQRLIAGERASVLGQFAQALACELVEL